jgi:uncharacterized protein (UPF0212 family)
MRNAKFEEWIQFLATCSSSFPLITKEHIKEILDMYSEIRDTKALYISRKEIFVATLLMYVIKKHYLPVDITTLINLVLLGTNLKSSVIMNTYSQLENLYPIEYDEKTHAEYFLKYVMDRMDISFDLYMEKCNEMFERVLQHTKKKLVAAIITVKILFPEKKKIANQVFRFETGKSIYSIEKLIRKRILGELNEH